MERVIVYRDFQHLNNKLNLWISLMLNPRVDKMT